MGGTLQVNTDEKPTADIFWQPTESRVADLASWQSPCTVQNDSDEQAASCSHKETITISLNGEQ